MLAGGVPVLRRGHGGCPGDLCGAAAGVRGEVLELVDHSYDLVLAGPTRTQRNKLIT
jgi:hypothetical protein